MVDEIEISAAVPGFYSLLEQIEGKENAHPPVQTLRVMEAEALSLMGAVGAQPIRANCNTTYHATKSSGRRPLSVIDLIVMHSTEGDTARGAAAWFNSPKSGGSAHLCLDDRICYRTLFDWEIPWGAQGANYHGFHIEQAGYARWTKYIWSKQHRNLLNRAAFKAAFHAVKYDISIRFLTAAQLRRGIRDGITTHAECSKAFGGDHTDPGAGWPRYLFMGLVRMYARSLSREDV